MTDTNIFFIVHGYSFSECIDCVVDWGEWGEVCSDGARSRSQVVVQETVGAGAACPDLQEESEGKRKLNLN